MACLLNINKLKFFVEVRKFDKIYKLNIIKVIKNIYDVLIIII